MKELSGLLLAVLLSVNSCSKPPPGKVADREFDAIEAAYSTNDVHGAERALRNYIERLSEQESNHVRGIDYDMARAIAHERLFLIYRKTDQTNQMEQEYQRSLESLTRYARRAGVQTPELGSYETFASNIEKSERNLIIKWKNEPPLK